MDVKSLSTKRKAELFDAMFSVIMCKCMHSSEIMSLLDGRVGGLTDDMTYDYDEEGGLEQLCYELIDPLTGDELIEALREHFSELLFQHCGAKGCAY